MSSAVAAVLVAAALVMGPGAEPASAETGLEATTPADGRHQPGRPTPVLITIRADEAVRGTVSVTFEGQVAASEVVELAGGTAKTVTLVVNTLPWSLSGVVHFRADGEGNDATTPLLLNTADGDELVAVLPGSAAPDLPATAALTVELGQARFSAIDSALLDLGTRALGPFSQVLTTAAELDDLDPARLATIERWVRSDGGRLVIDDDPSTPVPLDLGPDDAGGAVGLGSVVFTGGRAAAGAYDGLLSPTPTRSLDELPTMFHTVDPALVLARDAGFSIPSISNLVFLLLAYIVVVGPVMWLVLRRGRREPLMWLAIPALAGLSTLGIYGAGQVVRSGTRAAHATLAIDVPGSHLTVTETLVSRPGGGAVGVTLLDGWAPASLTGSSFMFDPSQPARAQHLDADELLADVPAGGAGVVSAVRVSAAADPAWSVDLVLEGDDLVGTVTNGTEHELREVVVASGAGVTEVGSVGPGETVEVTVVGATGASVHHEELGRILNGADPWNGPGMSGDGAGNPALLSGWLSRHPEVIGSGRVVVFGWTAGQASPLRTTDGATVEAGRTAHLTVTDLEPGIGLDRIELLRGWASTLVIDVGRPGACVDAPVAYRIRPEGRDDDDELALHVDTRLVAGLDIWNGREWQPAGMAEIEESPAVIPLPPGVLGDDGAIYLRAATTCDAWGADDVLPRLVTGDADA